jgi:hypothetical protein
MPPFGVNQVGNQSSCERAAYYYGTEFEKILQSNQVVCEAASKATCLVVERRGAVAVAHGELCAG